LKFISNITAIGQLPNDGNFLCLCVRLSVALVKTAYVLRTISISHGSIILHRVPKKVVSLQQTHGDNFVNS